MTILITGASGLLGGKLRRHLQEQYDLRLIDIDQRNDPKIFQADLAQWDADWVKQFEEVQTVVHFAGVAQATASWQEMIRPNMDAVVNVFNAAILGGAKRIIFASSNHVMGKYRDNGSTRKLHVDAPPQPGLLIDNDPAKDTTPYGAFKLAAERLGKSYADIHGISFIAVRIGYVHPDDNSAERLRQYEDWAQKMWLSDRDFCQLMTRCIEASDSLRCAIINGMSNNTNMRWEIESLQELIGYYPQDDVSVS